MNNAIVTFSFDDARLDSYRAIKLASEYGVKSTLNVTTGYVEGVNAEEDNPTHLPAMSYEQVVELNNLGAEIACHGDTHDNSLESILKGKEKLFQWLQLTHDQEIGFASPHSMIDIVPSKINSLKENRIVYLRVGPFVRPITRIKRLLRKTSAITQSKGLFCRFYKDTISNPVEDAYIIRSVPVMRQNGLEQMKAIVDYAIKKKGWLILMFHSVLDKGETGYNENFSWPLEDYRTLCEYIERKRNDLDCFTTMEAFKVVSTK